MHTELSAFPLQETLLPDGSVLQFRQSRGAGAGTVVLLHGIGSNSGSWLAQLQHGLNAGRVMAWDAPGYGGSSPVAAQRPTAQDYALKLWQWLDALGVGRAHLVGHSLGALMVARAAALQPQRVQGLTLLSPAQGYASASAADREAKRSERLGNLSALGVQGLADKRGAAMLSPTADAAKIAYAKHLMAQINVAGYTQAVHLLMDGDLAADLTECRHEHTRIACGTADTITPPAGCAALAARFNIPFTSIPNAGHAVAIDAPAAVNTFLSL